MKSQGRIIAIASLVLALSGCFQSEMPTAPSTPGADSPSAASNVITSTAAEIVNGYLVTFVGRTVVDGKTTFTYTVAGTGEASNLDRFVIQIPRVRLDSRAPSRSAVILGWTRAPAFSA